MSWDEWSCRGHAHRSSIIDHTKKNAPTQSRRPMTYNASIKNNRYVGSFYRNEGINSKKIAARQNIDVVEEKRTKKIVHLKITRR